VYFKLQRSLEHEKVILIGLGGYIMKLKCIDGVVREFVPSNDKGRYHEAYCVHCGYEFGVHDTAILKPEFRKHICKVVDKELNEKEKKCVEALIRQTNNNLFLKYK